MFRISKLTDYGTVVMTYLAKEPDQLHNARDITANTHIALPTVTKILKLLAREGLLISHRGANGGYSLAKPAEEISVLTIIEAIEGHLGLTECAHADSRCFLETTCATRRNWRLISNMVYSAMEKISLADMIKPLDESLLDLNILQPTATTDERERDA